MRNVMWGLCAFMIVVAFDHAMRVDRDNLCSNDLTAYSECSE